MPSYVTPGVYFETVDGDRRGITAIRTDIAAFVGLAERGPLHQPQRISSWEQFHALFGGLMLNGYLAYAVKAFFENGGQTCYVVRVAASTASCASGDVTGQDGSATFSIQAGSEGAWGDGLAVRVGRSSPAATRTQAVQQPEDGSASLLQSVTGFEVGSLVRIFQEQDAEYNLQTYRVATGVDAARRLVTWDAPLNTSLPSGSSFQFGAESPLFLETIVFSLAVYRRGRLHELFADLSLVVDHPRYVGRVVGNDGSHLIRIVDPSPVTIAHLTLASFPFPGRLPDGGDADPSTSIVQLQGGCDGLADLCVHDFTGSPGDETKRGLRTLEEIDEVAMVAVPDILIQPMPAVQFEPLPQPEPDPCSLTDELVLPPALSWSPRPVEKPPEFDLEQIFAVQQALVAHCETQGDRIALLDPPLFGSQPAAVDFGEIQSWRRRFDSSYAALYYPWLLVYDPLAREEQLVRAVPPGGHVAGLIARTDLESGVHRPPANAELRWVQDASVDITAEMQGVLNPMGVNCIRRFAGRGLRVYGARTASSHPDWRYVNVRRLLLMIEEAIEEATQWSVFEPNDFYLRQMLTLTITSFLHALWERGALVGATMNQAFYVKCDEENNPPAVTDLGQLVAEVGVAPVQPAEFIVFRIGRTADELRIVEWQGGLQWPF